MGAWLTQRVSAVYMAVYLPLYVVLAAAGVDGYSEWLALNSHPVIAVANVLFFGAVLLHGWVGVRDVIVDYIKPTGLRVALLVLLGGVLSVMGLWVLRIYMALAI